LKVVLNQQDDDFSCGVFALETLLSCHGIPYSAKDLRKKGLKAKPKTGLNQLQIAEFLTKIKIPHQAIIVPNKTLPTALPTPCLVNYQWYDEGHYATLLWVDAQFVVLANPGNGEIERIFIPEFTKVWHGTKNPKYGWSLRIL
jgi:ABC-type bacteriocin/lantibiotic exporter with double-glycine peptidase domain